MHFVFVYGGMITQPPFHGAQSIIMLYSKSREIAQLARLDENFLRTDQKENRRTYLRAQFDPEDGHLLHFVRRVKGSQERVEITVTEFRPVSATDSARDQTREKE